jgi:hypothetical protein
MVEEASCLVLGNPQVSRAAYIRRIAAYSLRAFDQRFASAAISALKRSASLKDDYGPLPPAPQMKCADKGPYISPSGADR